MAALALPRENTLPPLTHPPSNLFFSLPSQVVARPAPTTRPIPLPAPVVLGLTTLFRRRHVEAVFYDSAASDAEEDGDGQAHRPGGYRRRRAGGAAPVAPPTISTTAVVPPPTSSSSSAADDVSVDLRPGSTAAVFAEQDAALAEEGDRARVRAIRRAILDAGDDLRAAHPWLEPAQDAIGATLLLGALAANVAVALAFAKGALGWPATVITAALAQSILHELEHDLIHACYFAKRWGAAAVNAALALVYAPRLSTINPWARRRLHLNHHNAAGTPPDMEERAITNGMAWDARRLLCTGDNLLAIALRPAESMRELREYVRSLPEADPSVNKEGWLKERAAAVVRNALFGYLPLGGLHYGLWYAFLADMALKAVGFNGGAGLLGASTGLLCRAVTTYAAAFGASNFLRTFCLHIVSSNIHYVGIARGDVLNQTQVWTHPATWPAQLFCFCFGATHAIHHFVVRDPFYIRHLIAPRVLPVMKANGVRFNDFGTFGRANRVPPKVVEEGQAVVEEAGAFTLA
jgi:fatty acid desaturase